MRKIAFFIVLVLSLIAINNLVRSIVNLWQKNDLLVRAERQLQKEKKENETLKKELTRVQSPQFFEEEARSKLVLGKPGESLVLLPPTATSESITDVKKEENWKEWMKLFF